MQNLVSKAAHEISFENCVFYHTTEIPSRGLVRGQWDLRGHVDEYLGGYDFRGKRVLELGPASGFLTFEMERRGAQVVAIEVPDDPGWDFVPYSDEVLGPILSQRREIMKGVKNSFWFLHNLHQSKAQVYYGDPCRIPSSLGRFDVAVMASVLLHCERPARILAECAKCADTLIVAEAYRADLEGRSVCRFLPTVENRSWDTWWGFSTNFFVRYFAVLGHPHMVVTRHDQQSEHDPNRVPFFTAIGSRTELGELNRSSAIYASDGQTTHGREMRDESQWTDRLNDHDIKLAAYVRHLEAELLAKNNELERAANYARSLETRFARQSDQLEKATNAQQAVAVKLTGVAAELAAVKAATAWRMTEPVRVVADVCKRFVRKN